MHSGFRILLLFTILAAVIAVPVTSESVQVKFQGILLDRESRAGGGTLAVEITNILDDPGHVLNISDSVNITYMTGLPPGAQQDFEIDPHATVGSFVEVFCTETGGTLTLRDGNYVLALVPYTITATASAGGTIEPSGTVMVPEGVNQTFTLIPDPNQLDCWGSGKLYVVWNLTVDGEVVGDDPLASSKPVVYNFTDVQENHTIHAEFTYALINARPSAKFRADPTSGPAPLTVKFSQTVVSNNTGVLWSFGDNTTSTDPNPAHTYTSPGIYDVRFTIFCDNLSFSDPPIPITVLPSPFPNGTLYVASYPTNATILINGTDYGRTDNFVTVPSGTRNLTLTRDGYQPFTMIVRVPAGDLKVLAPVTLTKGGPVPPSGTGTLYIASYPTHATILINSTEYGKTDRLVTVPSGVRNLTLVKDGYQPSTRIVTVPAGDLKVLAPISLVPLLS